MAMTFQTIPDANKGKRFKLPKYAEFGNKCMVAEFIGLWGFDSSAKYKKLNRLRKQSDEISSHHNNLNSFNSNNRTTFQHQLNYYQNNNNKFFAPPPPPPPSAHGPGGLQVKIPASKLFSNLVCFFCCKLVFFFFS